VEDPLADYVTIPGNKVEVKAQEFLPLGQKSWDLEEHLK
jgi:hypothetical protein